MSSRPFVGALAPEIAALSRRQRHLEAAVATGESGAGWKLAREAFDRLDHALQVNPPTRDSLGTIDTSLKTLRAVLREGSTVDAVYQEMRANAETIRRLVAADHARRSPAARHADREAERERRLDEALAETGIRRPAPTQAEGGRAGRRPARKPKDVR